MVSERIIRKIWEGGFFYKRINENFIYPMVVGSFLSRSIIYQLFTSWPTPTSVHLRWLFGCKEFLSSCKFIHNIPFHPVPIYFASKESFNNEYEGNKDKLLAYLIDTPTDRRSGHSGAVQVCLFPKALVFQEKRICIQKSYMPLVMPPSNISARHAPVSLPRLLVSLL